MSLSNLIPAGGGFVGLRKSEDASYSAYLHFSPKVPELSKLNRTESLSSNLMALAWNGEVLIAVYAVDGDSEEEDGGGSGDRIGVFRTDGKVVTRIKDGMGPKVKHCKTQCQDGRPVSNGTWKGDSVAPG